MKTLRVCILLLALLTKAFTSFNAEANVLKPHNVVIESSYREKNLHPTLKVHRFDLQYPGTFHEPYFPEMHIDVQSLPIDFPQNTLFSWLTKFSGGLAEFLLRDNGMLENSIRLYQNGEYDTARPKLQSLLNSSSIINNKASLWLAWLEFRKRNYKESHYFLKPLLQSHYLDIKKEAYFLFSLLLINQNQYLRHYQLMQQVKNEKSGFLWGYRNNLTYLISLIKLGYWSEAETLLTINLKDIKHAKLYYLISEISGLINYEQNRYHRSLKHYLTAQEINPQLSYQKKMNRNIAWLYYLTGQFGKALELINTGLEFHEKALSEEILYLKLACLVKLQKWDQVSRNLSRLKPDSIYFTFSAFQIRSRIKNLDRFKKIKEIIARKKYREPNMKFYAALLEGNSAFVREKYDVAEQQYLRAMSVDLKSSDYWIIQYNLGLSYLKQKQFDKALNIFKPLFKKQQKRLPKILSYHLLYSMHQSHKFSDFLEILKHIHLDQLNPDQRAQVLLMKGSVLISIGKLPEAVDQFLELWRKTKSQAALESAIKVMYALNRFDDIIDLKKANNHLDSKTLYFFYVKALLGNRDEKAAYLSIKERDFVQSEFVQLRIEVLQTVGKYQELIDFIDPMISSTKDPGIRLLYYLSLGDAYFNQKRYQDSKHQFYKALNLVSTKVTRSLIIYNIVLTSFHLQKGPLFENEMKSILETEDLTDEIRFTLTQMLVDYYWQAGHHVMADRVLANYLEISEYQKTNAINKRIRLLFQSGDFDKCYQIANSLFHQLRKFDRRDRVIMVGYCGNKTNHVAEAVSTLEGELYDSSSQYRINELNFVLAQGYFSLAQYKKSYSLAKELLNKKLNQKIKHETQLLVSQNALRIGNQSEALFALGDLNQYRQTNNYHTSLKIRAQLAFMQNNVSKAVRTYLRLFYLPQTTPIQKQEILLRIAELYVDKNRIHKARDIFQRINSDNFAQEKQMMERYQKISNQVW